MQNKIWENRKKHDLFSVFPGISVCDNDVFPTISSLLIWNLWETPDIFCFLVCVTCRDIFQ